MEYYRITKYDPANRNEKGHYMFDHWTEYSDIGKIREGELVTIEDYLKAESDYINAVIKILRENDLEYLRVVGFDKKLFKQYTEESKSKPGHNPAFEEIDLYEDKKVSIEEIRLICQMVLRNYLHVTLEIKNRFYVHFGYDMYMYVGASEISVELLETLSSTSVFIEKCWSPYFFENLEYVLRRSKKRSDYIHDEQVLKDISINRMKEIMGLSDEHPGNLHTKVGRKIASRLSMDLDFTKYDYFLASEIVE